MNKKAAMALSQIFILLISIIAIGWIIGSEVGVVSGDLTTSSMPVSPGGGASASTSGTWKLLVTDANKGAVNTWSTGYDYNTGDYLEGTYSSDGNPILTSKSVSGVTTNSLSDNFNNLADKQLIAKYGTGSGASAIKNSFTTDLTSGIGETTMSGIIGATTLPEGWGFVSNENAGGIQTLKLESPAGDLVTINGKAGQTLSEATTTQFAGTEHGMVGKAWEAVFGKYTTGGWEYSTAGIIQGAVWAASVYGGVKMLGSMFGFEDVQVNAAAMSLSYGVFAGKTMYSLIGKGGMWENGLAKLADGKLKFLQAKPASIGVGLIVAAVVFYLTYKDVEQEKIIFTCDPWDAPTGGKDCEKCNDLSGGIPCSEYMCKSLGQSCELLNGEGEGEDSFCAWVNQKDVSFPIITPWENALLEGYVYTPDGARSPPDRGFIVFKEGTKNGKGCVQAFEPLTFGITTNEPAKCKIDYTRKQGFDDMNFWFGGNSLFAYNHTQLMALPGPNSGNGSSPVLQNNGNYELYVRCMDANGNMNTANVVFKFCVDAGPDLTPPITLGTNLINGMPISYNQTSVDLELYTNEPADCKWSRKDQSYEDMPYDMSCTNKINQINARLVYTCEATLDSLKDKTENGFYFRCKDQPGKAEGERNTQQQSYKFSLIGTRPLYIDDVSPNNEIIKDSTSPVKVTLEVKTTEGYDEGIATCQYSNSGNVGSYIDFYDTLSYQHSQDLYLDEGSYTYYIKCFDLGGNTDTETISFTTDSDSAPPVVVRVYKDESYLKIITDENATCVYDNVDCSYLFDDGTLMNSEGSGTVHYIDWSSESSLFIKCEDYYGNQPKSSGTNVDERCSIVVQPFEV